MQAKFAEQGLDFQPPALDTVNWPIFLPQAPGFNLQDLTVLWLELQDAMMPGDARMTAHLLDVLAHQTASLDYGTKAGPTADFRLCPIKPVSFLTKLAALLLINWPERQGVSQAQASHASY